MPAYTIRIPQDAAAALRDLAQVECRTPRDQAAFLVLQGLRAAATATTTPAEPRPRRARLRSTRAGGPAAEAEI